MKCPYCAEDVKDKAIVCFHCHRDLTFFKPVEQMISGLEERVSAIAADLSEVAAALSRVEDRERQFGPARAVERPSRLRLALVILSHTLLTGVLLAIYIALQVSMPPPSIDYSENPAAASDESSPESVEAWRLELQGRYKEFQREYEEYVERQNTITILFLPALVALPVAIGMWVGIRWRGGHFKSYLILGLGSGALEVLIFSVLVVLTESIDLKQSHYLLLALWINIGRCAFGFITGGLLGDWIERTRFPKSYERGSVARRAGVPAGDGSPGLGLESRVKSFAGVVTAMAPVIALVGTLGTAYMAYRGVTDAAERQAKAAIDAADKQAKAAMEALKRTPAAPSEPDKK